MKESNGQHERILALGLSYRPSKKLYNWCISVAAVMSLLLIIVYLKFNMDDKLAQLVLAVSSSLFASVLFSILMRIANDFRELESESVRAEEQSQLIKRTDAIEDSIMKLHATGFATHVKFHMKKTPHDRIQTLLSVPPTQQIHFSVMGIHLQPLYNSLIKGLRNRGNTTIYILLPNPKCPMLASLCKREGRTLEVVQHAIEDLAATLSGESNEADIVLKYTDEPSGVTILRIGDTILWRPRMHAEQVESDEHFCMEVNSTLSPDIFRILKSELGASWRLATKVESKSLERQEKL